MKKIFFPLSAFLVVIITVISILINRFAVRKVIIVSETPGVKGINIFNRSNIFTLNTDVIEKNLSKNNPFLKKVKIKKLYPDTILVETEKRKPFLILLSDNGKKNIDEEGVALDTDVSDLVTVEAKDSDFLLYSNSDWRILKSIKIINDFSKNNLIIEKIMMDNKEGIFKVYLNSRSEVTIPFASDINLIAASLQVIIQRFRIEGKTVSKIDFRFDKPIVVLSNGEKISSYSL